MLRQFGSSWILVRSARRARSADDISSRFGTLRGFSWVIASFISTHHRVSFEQLNIDLRNRNSIIRLYSLVHNYQSFPVFRPMISFARPTCGYIIHQHSNFSNVIETCISSLAEDCSIRDCQEGSFFRCRKELCFKHFSVAYYVR